MFARVEPLASSRLVIANEFRADLPPSLWDGDEQTAQIARAGERLDALDLLPAAFPIEEILSERDLRHVQAALRHRRALVRQRERAPAARRRNRSSAPSSG